MRGQGLPADAEDLGEFWYRTDAAWQRVLSEAAPRSAAGSGASGGGRTVVVVAHAAVAAALVCHCLGLGPEGLPLFRWGGCLPACVLAATLHVCVRLVSRCSLAS